MSSVSSIATAKAKKYGLDASIFRRLVGAESGGNSGAVSPVGALGAGQLMPGTAKSLGVKDPMDPEQNLEGAAKYLRAQLDRFGSYRLALAAYNAGPGAVEKHGGIPPYPETQAYVKKILGGSDPAVKDHAANAVRSRKTSSGSTTEPDPEGAIVSALLQGRPNVLLNAKRKLDSGSFTKTTPSMESAAATSVKTNRSSGGVPAGKSPLLEMFWQGEGGINVKHGKVVEQGFVSGHTDHVHVAAGPKTIVSLGKLAQRMGLTVGENPHFNGGKKVTSGHADNSYHYKDEAIDASGTPAQMRAYAHAVARLYGLKA